jgi:hypothetical protein
LDTGDAKSTGNMQKHAKECWGGDVIDSTDKANNVNEVQGTTMQGILNPESITVAFERTVIWHIQCLSTESSHRYNIPVKSTKILQF